MSIRLDGLVGEKNNVKMGCVIIRYTSLRNFILYLILLVGLSYYEIFMGLSGGLFWFVVFLFLLFTLISFKNYMIIADDEKLQLFKVFRKKRIIFYDDITKIEVEKNFKSKIHGTMIVLYFYIGNEMYAFDIYSLDNKTIFMKYLINKCINRGIKIKDLTSKEMIFWTKVSLKARKLLKQVSKKF